MSETASEGSFDLAVVGLWHLGAIAAAGWCETGRRVVGWDGDQELRSGLAAGRGPVVEPGLDEALGRARTTGVLTVSQDPVSAIGSAPVTHLAYDTRVGSAGVPDDPRLDEAVELFALHAPVGATLLVSSQLRVGTCARWSARLAQEERELGLAHAPENLRLGAALDGFLRPPRLVLGADDDTSYEKAATLLRPFDDAPIRTRLASAEMVKHATNTYLALCISFVNDLAWISLANGADPAEVSGALRADPRVSQTAPLRPGTAFSGETLGRDVQTLRAAGEECGRPDLFAAVLTSNDRHSRIAISWLEEALGDLRGTRIGVAGITYKPGTSTLRDSLPMRIVRVLLSRGAVVNVWDPLAEELAPEEGLIRMPSLVEAVEDADALAVLAPLTELADVDWQALRPRRKLVVDASLGVRASTARAAGWSYRGLSAE